MKPDSVVHLHAQEVETIRQAVREAQELTVLLDRTGIRSDAPSSGKLRTNLHFSLAILDEALGVKEEEPATT